MATLNQWGDDLDESLGDIAYEAIEDKAKEGAKEGAEATGKAAAKALDKATDRIGPLKSAKDKIKEKLSNNPITRAKAAIRKVKEKIKQAARNLAREGLHAAGRAAVAGAKAIGSFIAAHPVAAVIIFILLLIVMSCMDIGEENNDNTDNLQDDSVLLESPVYVNVDGMSDDDVVVVLMDDCIEQQYDTMFEMVDATKEEKAKSIYSVFHAHGFNNAVIAGILGNIDVESGLDSSAIEGIFSEYGILGTKKAEALLSIGHYTESTLFPKYRSSGTSINKDGYKTVNSQGDVIYYCGLGLVQWTGENAKMLLTAAENLNANWYNMDFQLGYMINDTMYRPHFFSNWEGAQPFGYIDDAHKEWFDEYTEGMTEEEIESLNAVTYADWYEDYIEGMTPEEVMNIDPLVLSEAWSTDVAKSWVNAAKEAAIHFAHEYEGNTGTDVKRKNSAVVWYSIIKDWGDPNADDEYAQSIGGLASDLASIINFIEIEEAQYRCLSGNVYDNSSIAAAAVSIAWPTIDQSYNNGTNLYQTVHDGIWPTDYHYKACDRAVAMAVRWSGTDIDYPLYTPDEIRYVELSPKWEKVGYSTSLSIGELMPGDIFLCNGHTFIYTGRDIIQSAYANEASPNSDTVSASLDKRSAACVPTASSVLNNGGYDSDGRSYGIYRCINPDNSDKYSSIGSGMTN